MSAVAPYHPQTQGKIERWHQTLKNRILLENYYLPGALEAQLTSFVDHYNHRRYPREHQQSHARRWSTSGTDRASSCNEKGSDATRSPNDACNIEKSPP